MNDALVPAMIRASELTLQGTIVELIQASLSSNSRIAYQSDLKHFIAAGGNIPCTPEIVACYLAAHAGKLSVATLCRRLVSIGKAHTTQGLLSPTKTDIVNAVMRGIRRTHGSAQKQVAPAIKKDLLEMVNELQGTKGIRDRALLLIGFAGAFRRSELVSLEHHDLEWVKEGLTIHLRRSKTDQEGEGRKIGIPWGRGLICPVKSLQAWLDISGITEGKIFRPINRHGQIAQAGLAPQAVACIVKARVEVVGLDPASYSGHSLRAGLVTSAAQAGVPTHKIMQQTGHRSVAMLQRYIRDLEIYVDNAAGAVL